MSTLSHCISQIFKVSEKKTERENNLPLLDLSALPQVKTLFFDESTLKN